MENNEKPKSLEERARDLDRNALDKIGEAARLNTRKSGLHRLDDSKVRCPLCEKRMEIRVDTANVLAIEPPKVAVCHTCRVGINVKDIYFDNWSPPGGKSIPCPVCEGAMRFFCTSTGYWRAECWSTVTRGLKGPRRCGATLSAAQPDRRPGVYKENEAVERAKHAGIDRPVDAADVILPTDPTVEEGNA